MEQNKIWTEYSKENVAKEPNTFGVYEIAHYKTGEVLFIGEGRIRSRLLAHLPEKHISRRNEEVADVYRYEVTGKKLLAIAKYNKMLEEFKTTHLRYPRFNTGKKD